MKQKGILVLSGVTLAMVAVAALALRKHEQRAAPPGERPMLFQGLESRVNDVAEISIEKQGKSATVRREGGEWKLADRGGYPAKFEQVKQTVVRVAQLQIEEEKTARASFHERLGVELPEPEPPAAPGEESEEPEDAAAGEETGEEELEEPPASEAALVTLKDSSGQTLASLVVGKTEWRGSTQKVYVRRADEDQVYLCSGRLDVNADPASWIDTSVLKLENDRVQQVAVTHADGEEVRVGRSATNHTQFLVENLPPGESERYEGVANGVAQALSALTLEDVRPVGEIDFSREPVARTRYRCHDGLELVLESARQDGKTWVKIDASYVEPPEPPASETAAEGTPAEGAGDEAGESEPAADDGEPAAEEQEGAVDETAEETGAPAEEKKDVRKEAEELEARLAPWAFALPQWKVDPITRRMKDLLKEPEPPPEAPEEAAEEVPEGAAAESPAEIPEAPLESPDAEDDEGDGSSGSTPGEEPEEPPGEEKPPGG